MIIGNLTKSGSNYTGELTTLSVGTRKLVFQPSNATGDKVPDFRVISPSKTGDAEFGAAWKRKSEEGVAYLSVRLDDPAYGKPFDCALMASKEGEDKFILVWSRPKNKPKAP